MSSKIYSNISSTPTRAIGDDHVSAIGFGAMGLSAFYGEVPSDEERFKILDAVYEQGCRFWDSADIYGDSEDLIGKWFERTGKRADIFLCSKCGFMPGHIVNGSAEYIKQAIEKSLRRLGVDCIDLYYLHRPDPNMPIEVSVHALTEFVKAGKIHYIGLSKCSASTLRRAATVHPITALEVKYSPFTLDIESPEVGLLAAARELGLKVIAYSPLGRGLLTGQYKSPDDFEPDDFHRKIPRYSAENFPNILKISDGLKHIGERHGATPGQVAPAWVLAQGDDFIPIPGTKKIKYLEENLNAAKIQLLPAEVAEIRAISKQAEASNGDRYPADMIGVLYGDTPAL